MADITVGNKTLTIPAGIVAKCAEYIKRWYNLSGDTPAEILDAWSDHEIEEVKRYLVDRIGQAAWDASMVGSQGDAEVAKDAAETQADSDLAIT